MTWCDTHFSELHLENFWVILFSKSSKHLEIVNWVFQENPVRIFLLLFGWLGFCLKAMCEGMLCKGCSGRRGCIPSPCVSLLGCCRPKGWSNILKLMGLFPLASVGSREVRWEEAAWPRLECSLLPSGVSLCLWLWWLWSGVAVVRCVRSIYTGT